MQWSSVDGLQDIIYHMGDIGATVYILYILLCLVSFTLIVRNISIGSYLSSLHSLGLSIQDIFFSSSFTYHHKVLII